MFGSVRSWTWPRTLLALLALVATVLTFIQVQATPAPARPFYTNPRPSTMLVAHMGGDDVWPGNTAFAYAQSAELGADVFDGDAHITKDGHIILMHDESVTRTTDGSGDIEDLTLAELRRLDAGYRWSSDNGKTYPYRGKGIRVPTLEELFEAYPQQRFLIEIKRSHQPIAKPLADLIRRYGMQDKIVIASFHDALMQEFRLAAPEVATSASKTEVTIFVVLQKLGLSSLISPRYQSLQVPWEAPRESMGIEIMTPAFVAAAHAKGIAVEPWTVNDPELMRKYIAWGVDGINSDRPDLLKAALGR